LPWWNVYCSFLYIYFSVLKLTLVSRQFYDRGATFIIHQRFEDEFGAWNKVLWSKDWRLWEMHIQLYLKDFMHVFVCYQWYQLTKVNSYWHAVDCYNWKKNFPPQNSTKIWMINHSDLYLILSIILNMKFVISGDTR
jgi:hypothetical protein